MEVELGCVLMLSFLLYICSHMLVMLLNDSHEKIAAALFRSSTTDQLDTFVWMVSYQVLVCVIFLLLLFLLL